MKFKEAVGIEEEMEIKKERYSEKNAEVARKKLEKLKKIENAYALAKGLYGPKSKKEFKMKKSKQEIGQKVFDYYKSKK